MSSNPKKPLLRPCLHRCMRAGGKREFTVQDIYKDTCKHLPNIQPQGSDIVRSANEDTTYLPPPPNASALEPSQVPTARCNYIASLADTPSWHDTITCISTLSLAATNWLYWLLPSVFTMFAHYKWDASGPRIHQHSHTT